MISDKYKCIFVHIPRTGGSSIEELLFPVPRTRDQLYGLPNKYQIDGLQHLMAKHIKLELPSNAFNTYFKFTFVRNPWDKAVSQFFYVRTRPDLMAFLDLSFNASFGDYLKKTLLNNHVHWEEQHKFIYDDSCNILVDFIGRFEQLSLDFKNVILNLGLNPNLFKLSHLNKTKHSHYSHYYDDETRKIVAYQYKTDIKRFGYFFEFEDRRRLRNVNNYRDTVMLNNLETQVSVNRSLVKRANKLKRGLKLNEATIVYKKAIELNPNFSWYYCNLGEALAQNGFFSQAVAQYQEAINLNSNCAYFYISLGKLFVENGHLDLALENLQKAVVLKPNCATIYKYLIDIYAQKEVFSKAIGCANTLIDLLLKRSELIIEHGAIGNSFNLGFVKLREESSIKEALGHFFKAVKLHPTFFRTYHCIGECLSILQQLDEAIAAYQISLKLNPSFYWSYHCMGKVLFRKGKDEQAIHSFQQAIKIQANVAVIHKNLGDVFVEKKDLGNAIDCYTKALDIDPTLLEVKSILDSLLTKIPPPEKNSEISPKGR